MSLLSYGAPNVGLWDLSKGEGNPLLRRGTQADVRRDPIGRSTRAMECHGRGGIFLLFLLEAATRQPTGWDAMVYHLPLAVKWLQQGSLAFIQESWKFQMPSNGDLFPLFLMSLGNERFLSFSCLPFTLLAVIAVYSLTRRVSDSHEGALLAALGFGTMPIVLYNTFDVRVDMFAPSFFLTSNCLLLESFSSMLRQARKDCRSRLWPPNARSPVYLCAAALVHDSTVHPSVDEQCDAASRG